MPSPFPGMNPYLEQEGVWHGFHHRFIPACSDLLVPQIRPKYIATIDVNVYLHELPGEERRLIGRPDVAISLGARPASGGSAAATEAPAYATVPLAVDVERVPFVEIRDRNNMALVTVIELLSPSNKAPGGDREQYLAKRREYLRSDAHLVEIDLLRGGLRMPGDPLPACDYCAIVSRVEERPRVGVWPVKLRERLPVIPIPLRAPDADAKLDLQEILNRVYDAAGYEDYIYQAAPQPPLTGEDAAWAESVRK